MAAAPEDPTDLEASIDQLAGDTMKDRDQALSHEDPEVVRKSEPKKELRSPWGDKIVWFQGLGYFCLGSNMVMGMMILPLMLNEVSCTANPFKPLTGYGGANRINLDFTELKTRWSAERT